MNRLHLVELEDLPWFPARVRAYMQDHLRFLGELSTPAYAAFVERLAAAMERVGTTEVLDVCSGGGGPLKVILRQLDRYGVQATVRLTDLYPNEAAFRRAEARHPGRVQGVYDPVDATAVPAEYEGFRLICNAFHHFPPELGRKILADAVAKRRGVALVEMVSRRVSAVLAMLIGLVMIPPASLVIRPFDPLRVLLSTALPIVPLCTLWDGVVSCLRVYSPRELRELVAGLDDDGYEWDIGELRVGPGVITYLIGVPR